MEKLPSDTSFDDYSNKSIKILLTVLQDIKILDSYPFIQSDLIWEGILLTRDTEIEGIKVLQFWTIKDDHVYIISFGSTSDSYFGSLPTVSKRFADKKIYANNTNVPPSNNAYVSIYTSPQEFFLNYPNTWNKELRKNRVAFIAHQENPDHRYLERVDFYHYGSDDNINATTRGTNDFIKLDLINEIEYLASNLENLQLIQWMI